jgi:hypothetical protein
MTRLSLSAAFLLATTMLCLAIDHAIDVSITRELRDQERFFAAPRAIRHNNLGAE